MNTVIDTENVNLDIHLADQAFERSAFDLTLESNSETVATNRINILIAHEVNERCSTTKALLKKTEWSANCHRVTSVEDLNHSLNQNQWDLIIAYGDSTLFRPAVVGKQIEQCQSAVRAIYLEKTYSATNALQIIHCGFHDYLTEGEEDRLLFIISREIQSLRYQRKATQSDSVLAEAKAKSKLLLDTTADAVAYIADGTIIHANHVFISALGFAQAEDIELQPIVDLVHAGDQKTIKKIIKKMGSTNEELPNTQITLLGADQQEIAAELTFSSASHDGEPCTQVIIRSQPTSRATNASVVEGSIEPPKTTHTNSKVVFPNAHAINTELADLEKLSGKGLIYFISLRDTLNIRKSVSISQYSDLLVSTRNVITALTPEATIVVDYIGDSWIAAIPEQEEPSNLLLGENLCDGLNQLVGNITKDNTQSYAAIGIAKYGVADMSSTAAIDKAFSLCAEQLDNGGFKVFSPRIDNAQGSAALKSAMELDRLKIKYQPIIGLHNQSTQWYEASVFICNDSGIEQDATQLLESLGIEKDNVALDQWLINKALNSLEPLAEENPAISLCIPLTASAITDVQFSEWLINTIQSKKLAASCLKFSITVEQAQHYEHQCHKLLSKLIENGLETTITNVTPENFAVVRATEPSAIQLHNELTKKLNDAEDNSKESLQETIAQAVEMNITCIATGVNTASDLAHLWQTGAPYIQGNYLQAPLSSMSYGFSDMA
ncbi:MAG: EAL domain-containing protein [Pseudomonadales bacterium]|nr:EAL domain-containing protein [Pseudomonadales bacterium]